MKYKIEIVNVQTVDEITEYWTNEDYIQLLEKFDYPDAEDTGTESLRELLFMAISDFEASEAAKVVLAYKLGEHLSEGQIDQISNDMQEDKVCEEYPKMELQAALFHVNQLLFKAYNGKFPSSSASIIQCFITPLEENDETVLTKEMVLRLFNDGLSDRNIVKRLFEEQMKGNADFPRSSAFARPVILKSNSRNSFFDIGSGLKPWSRYRINALRLKSTLPLLFGILPNSNLINRGFLHGFSAYGLNIQIPD